MRSTGVTLVEVAVGLLLLAVGALALAGSILHAQRAHDRSIALSLALAEAEARLEAWRVSPWSGAAAAGSEPVAWGSREGTVTWAVEPRGSCLESIRVRVVAGVRAPAAVALASRRFRDGADGC